MRNLELMQIELNVLKSENSKCSKEIYECRKKGKTLTGTNLIEKSNFFRTRMRNLYVNINQEMIRQQNSR